MSADGGTDTGDGKRRPSPLEIIEQVLAGLDAKNDRLERVEPTASSQASPNTPTGESFEERKQKVKDHADLNRRDHVHESAMRRALGPGLLAVMVFQLLFVDLVMVKLGRGDWQISDSVIATYLGATMVEIIGVVTVMVKFYFSEARWKDS